MTNTAIDRLRSLRVADAMTVSVIPLRARQSIAEAAHVFAERHISSAPVIDDDGLCVGVFSMADLLKTKGDSGLTFQGRVADIMSAPVRSTTPEASLLTAAALMSDNHVHRIPVLNHDGRLAGVLSTMDIVAALLNAVEEMDAALVAEIRRETERHWR